MTWYVMGLCDYQHLANCPSALAALPLCAMSEISIVNDIIELQAQLWCTSCHPAHETHAVEHVQQAQDRPFAACVQPADRSSEHSVR
jgi:hypothetical protein